MVDRAKKITELPALTTAAGEDLIVIVDDPSGTANTKKITVSNFLSSTTNSLFANVSVTVGANTTNAYVTPGIVTLRESTTANVVITPNTVTISNSTSNVSLTSSVVTAPTVNAVTFVTGNSTINATVNSTMVMISNATVSSNISNFVVQTDTFIGANSITIGNSTVNSVMTFNAFETITLSAGKTVERFDAIDGGLGVVELDCTRQTHFKLTNISGNVVPNLVNLDLSDDYFTEITISVDQNGTPHSLTGIQIAGQAQTISWPHGTPHPGLSNTHQYFKIQIYNEGSGSYDVHAYADDFSTEVKPDPQVVFHVAAVNNTAYTFTGGGSQGSNNETLYLMRGFTYEFYNTTGASHPFNIRVSDGGAAFSNGVIGNANYITYFTIPQNLSPGTILKYQCSNHAAMIGDLVIV